MLKGHTVCKRNIWKIVFLLTPSEYSASGSSIDLNLVTLRQQNVENVPSLVCLQSTSKWINLFKLESVIEKMLIMQSVGLISLINWKNLTRVILTRVIFERNFETKSSWPFSTSLKIFSPSLTDEEICLNKVFYQVGQ